ncbi:FAD-dependent oxidoreductase [Paludibacterium purpuratum]|uniref:Kynurenine 3-monooxygenase n=1 Tax=Paludibacterium purpuratum TaxID=1144873 RepID=A0A4R7BCP1_9NEIS|nr:NAD(P)/FAD-dependent oxidoreductase [Paludibacterium purpuratum]TDR81377.1 kynurenine 3-monooxygenase [Paludibacterium purpuratum]
MQKVIIVGGGLAGGLTAIYLARRGFHVHVVEKRGDPLCDIGGYVDTVSSRAIGVSMTVRGIQAVLAAGIPRDQLEQCGERIVGMAFCVGGKYRVRDLRPQEEMYPLSLNRAAFQRLLNTHAVALGVTYDFEQKCLDVDLEEKSVLLQAADGQIRRLQGDWIIGADGAYSAVRQAMQNSLRRFEFQQTFFRHGYKTLVLPDAEALGFRKDLLYFFGMDSKGLFAGRAATIPDGSVSIAVCLPYHGEPSLASEDRTSMKTFFSQYFIGLPQWALDEMLAQFLVKPSNDLINVRSSTFHYKHHALLLGDAAHATAPFLGQGMNMALEDARSLDSLLDQYGNDLLRVLPAFTQQRKVQADAMQDMARANYDVLSSASPIFFLRTRYTRYMHRKFPRHFPPDMADKLYFTAVPYDVLQQIQRKQNVWYKFGRVN